MSSEQLTVADVLEAHQLTPRFSRDGTVWACKAKRCSFTAPTTERAGRAEAQHQADVLRRMGSA